MTGRFKTLGVKHVKICAEITSHAHELIQTVSENRYVDTAIKSSMGGLISEAIVRTWGTLAPKSQKAATNHPVNGRKPNTTPRAPRKKKRAAPQPRDVFQETA